MSELVKVRAIKAHANRYGGKYRKAVDDEYELPEPMAKALAAQGLVRFAAWSVPLGFLDRKVDDIAADLDALDFDQLAAVRADEEKGKTRTSLIAAIDARIAAADPQVE